MAYAECLPTRLNPLAERTCFSQVGGGGNFKGHYLPLGEGPRQSCPAGFGITGVDSWIQGGTSRGRHLPFWQQVTAMTARLVPD
jgi:hypothetical protein